jgi:hypothetical protein
MARAARPLALALALAGASVAAAAREPSPASVVVLENAARGRAVSFRVAPGGSFSVTSQHSMYDAPVTEEFSVGEGGAIVLRAVWSPSAAVREYFGLTAAGERHEVRRVLPEIVFRVATGAPQRLDAGGETWSFRALGEPGDRLVLRAARAPAAR